MLLHPGCDLFSSLLSGGVDGSQCYPFQMLLAETQKDQTKGQRSKERQSCSPHCPLDSGFHPGFTLGWPVVNLCTSTINAQSSPVHSAGRSVTDRQTALPPNPAQAHTHSVTHTSLPPCLGISPCYGSDTYIQFQLCNDKRQVGCPMCLRPSVKQITPLWTERRSIGAVGSAWIPETGAAVRDQCVPSRQTIPLSLTPTADTFPGTGRREALLRGSCLS